MECAREMKCPACGDRPLVFLFPARDYISSHTFDLYRCAKCGVGLTRGGPESIDLMRYYGKRYYGKRMGFVGGFTNYARVRKVSGVVKKKPHPLALDVGCGNGSLVCDLRKRGIEAYGTEVAPPEHFRKDALPFIRRIDFKESGFPSEHADVIMFWHVLEHLPHPEQYLVEARRILKDGGSLIVEVPNFESWQARLFKAQWLHLDVPRHVVHFSPENISLLLKKAGFTEIRFRSGSLIYGYFGYLQSLLNTVSERKNLFFDFLNGKVGLRELVARHAKDFYFNVFCFIPALVLGGVFMLGESAAGKSGIMLVYAKKE